MGGPHGYWVQGVRERLNRGEREISQTCGKVSTVCFNEEKGIIDMVLCMGGNKSLMCAKEYGRGSGGLR